MNDPGEYLKMMEELDSKVLVAQSEGGNGIGFILERDLLAGRYELMIGGLEASRASFDNSVDWLARRCLFREAVWLALKAKDMFRDQGQGKLVDHFDELAVEMTKNGTFRDELIAVIVETARQKLVDGGPEKSLDYCYEIVTDLIKNGKPGDASVVAMSVAKLYMENQLGAQAGKMFEKAAEMADLAWFRLPMSERVNPDMQALQVYDDVFEYAESAGNDDLMFRCAQWAKSPWLRDVLALNFASTGMPLEMISKLLGHGGASKDQNQLRTDFYAEIEKLDSYWATRLKSPASAGDAYSIEQGVLAAYDRLVSVVYHHMKSKVNAVSAGDVRSKLAPGEAILDIYFTRGKVVLMLLKPEGLRIFRCQVSAGDVISLALRVYAGISVPEGSRRSFSDSKGDIDEIEKVFRQALREGSTSQKDELRSLYDALIAPLGDALSGVGRLIVCPHGNLHVVPFHALKSPDGLYLAEKPGMPAMVYCPSAVIWSVLRDIESTRPASGRNGVVLGIKRDSGTESRGIDHYIGALIDRVKPSDFEGEAQDVASALKARPLLKDAASKQALLEALPGAGFVHVSCHCKLGVKNKLLNGLMLSDGVLSTAEILVSKATWGAKPSLICLSACRSAIDVIGAGDTFCGVGYGFLARCGCRVLSSDWEVDSKATRMLMGEFYEQCQPGTDPAAALKKAQQTLMASPGFKHPYYWAGFFLMGS